MTKRKMTKVRMVSPGVPKTGRDQTTNGRHLWKKQVSIGEGVVTARDEPSGKTRNRRTNSSLRVSQPYLSLSLTF